jgi:hypothetical protein
LKYDLQHYRAAFNSMLFKKWVFFLHMHAVSPRLLV